jgi:hypothetical protein
MYVASDANGVPAATIHFRYGQCPTKLTAKTVSTADDTAVSSNLQTKLAQEQSTAQAISGGGGLGALDKLKKLQMEQQNAAAETSELEAVTETQMTPLQHLKQLGSMESEADQDKHLAKVQRVGTRSVPVTHGTTVSAYTAPRASPARRTTRASRR